MNTRMLRPLLFLLLTPMAFSTLHAQDDDTEQPAISADRLQQIKAQKSAFITQRLSLTAEEARTFWPIYDKYDTEIAAVRKEMRSDRRNRKSSGTLTVPGRTTPPKPSAATLARSAISALRSRSTSTAWSAPLESASRDLA